jgi:hypothetical protein
MPAFTDPNAAPPVLSDIDPIDDIFGDAKPAPITAADFPASAGFSPEQAQQLVDARNQALQSASSAGTPGGGSATPPSASLTTATGFAASTRNAIGTQLAGLSQKLGPFGPLIAVTAGILGTIGVLSALHRIKPAPAKAAGDRSRSRYRSRYSTRRYR